MRDNLGGSVPRTRAKPAPAPMAVPAMAPPAKPLVEAGAGIGTGGTVAACRPTVRSEGFQSGVGKVLDAKHQVSKPWLNIQ